MLGANMDELFSVIEGHIKALTREYEREKQANKQFQQQQQMLLREKDLLLLKHKQAITQIEHMVARLKSLENPQ